MPLSRPASASASAPASVAEYATTAGTALYGGTFNPTHLGHLHVARAVADQLGLARINLVLSARPPHRDPVPTPHRWAMLELACQLDQRLYPDDRELNRAEPSYTVDTLTLARRRQPWTPLYWIVGMDSLLTLTSWYRWWRILQLAHLVVVRRPGYRVGTAASWRRLAQRRLWQPPTAAQKATTVSARPPGLAGRIVLLEQAMLDVSGSGIRASVRAGRSPAGVAANVADYINQHSLYQN